MKLIGVPAVGGWVWINPACVVTVWSLHPKHRCSVTISSGDGWETIEVLLRAKAFARRWANIWPSAESLSAAESAEAESDGTVDEAVDRLADAQEQP
jgi:hypothetical protein